MTEETEQSETQKDPTVAAELRMLYEGLTSHIRELKGRQWAIAYYGVLLYAGIVGFVATTYGKTPPPVGAKCALSTLSVLVTGAAVWMLISFQHTMMKNRERLERLYPRLTQEVRTLLEPRLSGHTSFRYNFLPIQLTLWAVQVAGSALVLWTLWGWWPAMPEITGPSSG